MNLIVLTPVQFLGDGLCACLSQNPEFTVVAVMSDLAKLRETLVTAEVDLVLIDVIQDIDLYDVRAIAADRPDVALVALGLNEQRQEVIRCGRAGFSGYVVREASIDDLSRALSDVIEGRLACPEEISGDLLRALFKRSVEAEESGPENALTRRESDVLRLIGQGFSNKEIARELYLSIATIKHHVHNILGKLNLPTRAQAMRRVRDAPWLLSAPDTSSLRKAVPK